MSNIIKITDINQKQDKFLDSLKHRADRIGIDFNKVTDIVKNTDMFLVRYKVGDIGEADCIVLQPKNLDKKIPSIIWLSGGVPNSDNHRYTKSDSVFGNRYTRGLLKDFIVFIPKYSDEETELIDTCGGDDVEIIKGLNEVIDEWEYANEKKVALYGISRGVMSSIQSIRHIKNVKSAVLVSGAYEDKIEFELRKTEKRFISWFPYDIEDEDELKKRDYLTYIDDIDKDIKIYVIHGTNDVNTSVLITRNFVEKRREVAPDTIFDELDTDHYVMRGLKEKGEEHAIKLENKIFNFFKDSLLE